MKKYVAVYIIPLIAVVVLSIVVFFAGDPTAAWMVAYFGTGIVTLACVAYVVLFDSRSRWPHTSWLVRLGRLFWFQR